MADIDRSRPRHFHARMYVQRQPLAVSAAQTLRSEIENGTWNQRLPGEMKLSAELGISRSTLRNALEILRQAGLLKTRPGMPTLIKGGGPRPFRGNPHLPVNVLMPFAFERLPNFAIFWIDGLRMQLHSRGFALNLIPSHGFYREKAEKSRESLMQQHPSGCWVLSFSKPDIQRWFQNRNIPAVIAGHREAGIHLPSVGTNSRAIMFHMIGRLTSCGHRRIALLTGNASTGGVTLYRQSFNEICREMGQERVMGRIIFFHDESPETGGRDILHALRLKDGPTALIIVNPLHVVTAFSFLPRNGVVIPDDVSIVTTFGDRNLDHLSPSPSRYYFNANIYVRKLLETIQKVQMGMSLVDLSIQITPEPISGKSISRPR